MQVEVANGLNLEQLPSTVEDLDGKTEKQMYILNYGIRNVNNWLSKFVSSTEVRFSW